MFNLNIPRLERVVKRPRADHDHVQYCVAPNQRSNLLRN